MLGWPFKNNGPVFRWNEQWSLRESKVWVHGINSEHSISKRTFTSISFSSINPWNVTHQPLFLPVLFLKYFCLGSHTAHSHFYKPKERSLLCIQPWRFCASTTAPSIFGIYQDNKRASLYTIKVKLRSKYTRINCLMIERQRVSARKPITHTTSSNALNS